MNLFVAEKPSMAKAIASVLGNPKKLRGYYQTDNGLVVWSYGHLLQQYMPDDYDINLKKWNESDLPIIPKKWELKVTDRTKQYAIDTIKKLINDPKVTTIINAGDPDREGQLLIDEIFEFIGVPKNKTIKRIILNALDEISVRRALETLEDNAKYHNWYLSALARQRVDWLLGINLTRKITLKAQEAGHTGVFNIGRVKTPVLGLIEKRNEDIKNFISHKFYTIKASFADGINLPFFVKYINDSEKDILDSEKRLIDILNVNNIINELEKEKQKGTKGIVSYLENKKKTNQAPLPFSLTKIQIEAGKNFGYSPDKTLEIIQKLYEKKIVSYPRSDSQYLKESQKQDAITIIKILSAIDDDYLQAIAKNSDIDTNLTSPAWNDKKVTAHHAIIPTMEKIYFEDLSEDEKNIYRIIAVRYLAQFYPPELILETEIKINFKDNHFQSISKEVIKEGWKILYGKANDNDSGESNKNAGQIPSIIKIGSELTLSVINKIENKTTPPKYFNLSNLVGEMEDIHTFVTDKNLREILKVNKGLGTVATRATILKELIESDLIIEKAKKNLFVTEKGKALLSVVPNDLKTPDKTALMEIELDKIYRGEIKNIDQYIDEVANQIREIISCSSINNIKRVENLISCSKCQIGVMKKIKGKFGYFFVCSNQQCKHTMKDDNGKPVPKEIKQQSDIKCPNCEKGFMLQRKGPKNTFLGCSNYPECKTTMPVNNRA